MKKAGFIIYLVVSIVFAGLMTFLGISPGGAEPDGATELPDPKPYLPIQAPPINQLEDRSWVKPPSQDDQGYWQIEAFTPPKIYLDENGGFTAKPPEPPPPPPPEKIKIPRPSFGISLDSVYRPPFRVLLQASIVNPNDPQQKFVMLEHSTFEAPAPGMKEPKVARRDNIRADVGKLVDQVRDLYSVPNPDGTYKMIPINIQVTKVDQVEVIRGGLKTKVYQAEIKDFNSLNSETGAFYSFLLTAGDKNRAPGPDVYFTVRYTGDPGVPPALIKNPQVGRWLPFEIQGVKYTIKSFSESPPSITLEKKYKWVDFDGEPPVEVLEAETVSIGFPPTSPLPGATPAPGSPASLPIPGGASPGVHLPIPGSPSALPLPGSVPTLSPAAPVSGFPSSPEPGTAPQAPLSSGTPQLPF